jgi:hypothetical protein
MRSPNTSSPEIDNAAEWSPHWQEPEALFNNATSRVLRREPPAGAGGLQVAGFIDWAAFSLMQLEEKRFIVEMVKRIR